MRVDVLEESQIVYASEASQDGANRVIQADPESNNGRSQWFWLVLDNGDVLLATYPQGDTYSDTERDRQPLAKARSLKENDMVDVVFRKHQYKGEDISEIVAVFPEITWSRNDLQCYAHAGQHGACTRGWYVSETKPAKPEEYAPLLEELKRVGYQELTVKTRIPRKNWLRSR